MMGQEPHESFTAGIKTVDQLLEALRKGSNQKLEIGLGELKVNCRLISAKEEVNIMVKAKQKALKENPTGLKQEVFEAQQVMRSMISAATTISGAPQLPDAFLDALSSEELSELYDQYISINHTVNPNLQGMSHEEIMGVVQDVKKKSRTSKDLYSYQLQAIGKYFLDVILANLPTVNERG